MELPQRTFTITERPSNRYFYLACEIQRALGIEDRDMLMGLFKRKGIQRCEDIFREVVKDKTCENRMTLYLFKLSELPNKKIKRKPRQLKLKL